MTYILPPGILPTDKVGITSIDRLMDKLFIRVFRSENGSFLDFSTFLSVHLSGYYIAGHIGDNMLSLIITTRHEIYTV